MTTGLLALGALAASAVALGDKPGTKPAPAAKPARQKPVLTLKWSTASEVDNYGFFIMRGDTEKGPFKQLNEQVVPGAGNADVPSKYVYEDKDVVEGRTYYYYLDSISLQGVREKFSPVLTKVCCGRPEPAKVVDDPKPEPLATPSPAAPEAPVAPSPRAPAAALSRRAQPNVAVAGSSTRAVTRTPRAASPASTCSSRPGLRPSTSGGCTPGSRKAPLARRRATIAAGKAVLRDIDRRRVTGS
jgi:hypothetical protein